MRRLDRNLGSIFVQLEPTIGATFEQDIIKGILFYYFDRAVEYKSEANETTKRFQEIQWLERKLSKLRSEAQRKEKTLNRFDDTFRLWRRAIQILKVLDQSLQEQIEKEIDRQPGARKFLDKRCAVVSEIVTALADYFWHETKATHSADSYKFIGAFLTQMTVPNCLACGKSHVFPNWRTVRERDRFRGRWETRKDLICKAQEEEHQKFLQDLGLLPQEIKRKIETSRETRLYTLAFDTPVLQRDRETRIEPTRHYLQISQDE